MLCFPEVSEVRLRRSPLAEVICQVRFPAILRIVGEEPVQFQERVRREFPELRVEHGLVVEGAVLQAEQPAMKPVPRTFRFKTPDEDTAISLAPDFVSVSTTAYSHWSDFAAALRLAVDALCDAYDPAPARRVGLRYINRVTFENTGLDNVPELLGVMRDCLTAPLRDPCWTEPPAMLNQLLFSAGQSEKLSLRSGFEGGEEPTFLLDLDYFGEGQVPLPEVLSECERYHHLIYRVFRWCIREGKLRVFRPEEESANGC